MANQQILSKELIPYIPRAITDWYRTSPEGEAHQISELTGILLCIDASGFTALTEELAQEGRGGPEILTSILNSFFEEMAGVVFAYGGDILKFAGDALWAFVPQDCPLDEFHFHALEALRRSNATDERTRIKPLSIHIGAESGTFALASLGDYRYRLEAEPIGTLVNDVYRICDEAGTNQLLVGPNIAQKLSQQTGEEYTKVEHSFLVDPVERPAPVHKESLTSDSANNDHSEMLERYLPADVTARLKSTDGSQKLQSEHRQVVALFGYFLPRSSHNSQSARDDVGKINDTLSQLFRAVTASGGSVARIDPYNGGHKLLILFGALKKRDDDPLRAIACTRKLLDLHTDEFELRFGLALGSLFCGNVGASMRREYTIMGGAANMAARLMSKADRGTALIDGKLRAALPGQIQTTTRVFSLKGIGEQTPAYELGEVQEVAGVLSEDDNTVGQQQEAQRLHTLWTSAQSGKKSIIVVSGETGVGKSHLLRNLVTRTGLGQESIINCDNAMLFGRGWILRKTLNSLLGDTELDLPALLSWCESVIGSRWSPLLGDMFGAAIEDNEWTRGLSPELREAKLNESFASLINRAVMAPTILVIDNFEKCDEFTRTLLLSLVSDTCNAPLFLALISRETDAFTEIISSEGVETLELIPPTSEVWWGYFEEWFESGKREVEFFTDLLRASHGNPMVVRDFVSRCQEQGQLSVNPLSGLLEVIASDGAFDFPENFISAHLSRFDDLPEQDRSILKRASIVGGAFTVEWLMQSIDEDREGDERAILVTAIPRLVNSGILIEGKESGTLLFNQPSMREAIYSCLPVGERRRLHLMYVQRSTQERIAIDPSALAYHAFEGGDYSASFLYSLQATRAATAAHALTDAVRNLRRGQEIIDTVGEESVDVDALLAFYLLQSQSLLLAGRYQETYPVYRRWRRLGKAQNKPQTCIQAALETAQTLWRQSRYDYSRKIMMALLGSPSLTNDNEHYAASCSIMADLERRVGNFSEACRWCELAIESAQITKNAEALSDAHNKLGLNLWGMGQLERATREFTESLGHGAAGNGLHARARTVNNLGIVHYAQGHFLEAERGLTEALGIFGDIGDTRNEAYASGNLANISRHLGKFSRSKELFGRADLIFERLKDSHAHHYTVGNLGDIDLICGDLAEAGNKFTCAAEFAQAVDDKELISECDVRFGELAFFSSDMSTARNRYELAIERAREISSKEWLMRGNIGLARLCVFERNQEKAQELIDEVSELAKRENAYVPKNEAIFLTGEIHRIAGDAEGAAKRYEQVLTYARQEELFELSLKAAIRLWEVSPSGAMQMETILMKIANSFVKTNTFELWSKLLQSAYFSFFSETLNTVFAGFDAPKPHTV